MPLRKKAAGEAEAQVRRPWKKESGTSPKPNLAHVRGNEDGSCAIHDLEEHLRAVGDLAGEFASTFGHSDWARLAGLWHDLGKYFSAFQSYIARGIESGVWIKRVEK